MPATETTRPAAPLRVAIISTSTRPRRRSPAVAQWVLDAALRRRGVEATLVDIADYALPVLDEPQPAAFGEYAHTHTHAWAETIASHDAFVFVTPEYNHSIPGGLKNAIDFLYAEWHDKAAGFVSYGVDAGGARAVEHLRGVMGELQVADVQAHVALSLKTDCDQAGRPHAGRDEQLEPLLDQLIAWGTALRVVRSAAAAAEPREEP